MTFFIIILFSFFIVSVGLLLYIYIGYPLIIVVLAKLFRRPIQKTLIFPTITIVIPTHNEEAVIREKLDNILSLDYPRNLLQIIVCDDASNDSTTGIVRKFSYEGIELSEESARAGKVGALNRALQLATGEIFIITDADIIVSKDSLRELIANFADENVGCVISQTRMLASESEASESGGLYWRYETLLRQSESNLHSTVAATGHMMGLRRKIMRPIPTNIILDDFYLAMMTIRQGYRVISEPKSIVWERPTESIGDEANRRRRLTAGRYQMLLIRSDYLSQLPNLLRFEVVSHKFLRLVIPHFMILALATNILLAINLPAISLPTLRITITILLVFQGIFYFMALVGKLLSNTTIKKLKLSRIFILAYFLCATNFASIAGLLWYLSGQYTVKWQQAKRG